MNAYREKSVEQESFEQKNTVNGDVQHESLLETLLRQRWTVLVTAGFFLTCAIIYLIKAVPIYTSSSSIYVEQTGPKLISEYEGVMTRSKNYLNTQGEVIKSTPILAKVVEKPEIQQLKTFDEVDNLVTFLKMNLQVNIGRKDDIITVSFDSPYPEEAAQLVNEVVSEYINYHASQKRSTVSEVLRILQKEKVKRDKELSEKFDNLLEFTRTNGVTAFEHQGDHIVLRRLSTLSDALTKAQLETISAKADLEAAEKMATDPERLKYLALSNTQGTAAAISNSEEREIRLKLRELQQRLQEARRQCTDEHPLVAELMAKISNLEEQLGLGSEEFATAYIEVLRRKYETARQREGELLASFSEQQDEAQALGLKATEYSVLQSELERTKRLCEILDERIKELNVTEDAGALNISVLEVAQVEDSPSKPQKAKILAMALVIGVLFGCGTAVLRDWLDYRLRSVEEISAILGVPVLGVVPKMAATVEQTIVARGKRFWHNLKGFAAEGHAKINPRAIVTAVGNRRGGSTDRPSARVQNRRLIAQLVMDCGKKMAARLSPVIAEVCKSIGLNLNSNQSSRIAGRRDSVEPKTDDTSQKNSNENEKSWLKSQATVAQVYQQRLDRALFGRNRKETQVATGRSRAVLPRTNCSRNTPHPAGQTMSQHGQEICHKPRSVVAEAYRTIRTAVFFGVPKDEAKTILVTSPAPGDGKSTLVSNLAIAMAQAGQKTLVFDCDFRKPVQQIIFNGNNEKGISNIFAENLPPNKVIQHGSVAGLDILTRGPEVPNPCELLNSTAFTQLLKKLSERYDRVIIDSAPVTAVADSQILSAVSDVTILVLRAEKSTRRLSQLAMHMLLSVGARVLGVVVNGVPVGGGHYGYYYGYGYYGKYGYYGYGHGSKDAYYRESDHKTAGTEQLRQSEVKV
jgi:capsular exopolysaccharide synthesis family protein